MNMTPIAQSLAAQGRNGDSMLVHMTPGEVRGLQALALSQGGSLSINPATGLPEANFLKRILPLVAGVALGPAGLGLSAMQAGLVVGGLGTLATGSLGKGLMMGLSAGSGASLAGSLANLASPAPLASAADLTASNLGPAAETMGADALASQTATTPAFQAAQSNIDPALLENMNAGQVANAKVLPLTPNAPGMGLTDRLASGVSNVMSSPQAAMDFVKENPYSLAGTATSLAYNEPKPLEEKPFEYSPYALDITNTSGDPYPMSSAEREQLKYRFRALPTYKAAQGGSVGANTAIRYAEGGETTANSEVPTSALFSSYTTPAVVVPSVSAAPAGLPGLVSANAGDVYQNIARTQQMLGLPALDTSGLNIAPRPQALKAMTFEEKQDALANRRMTDMFQNVLGRAPTADELRQYTTKFGVSADPMELRQFRNEMEEAGFDTQSSFRFPGLSDVAARAYLEANPGMTDAAYATWMKQSGVTPQQISDITGVPVEQVTTRYDAGISSGQGVIPEKSPGTSVEFMFQSMLGREASPEELVKWKNIVGDAIDPGEIRQFRREYKKLGENIYNKKPEGYVAPSKSTASSGVTTGSGGQGEYKYDFDPRTGKFTTVNDPTKPTTGATNAASIPGMEYDPVTNSYRPIDMGGSAAGGLLKAKKYAAGGSAGLSGLNAFAAGGGRFLNGPGDGVSDSIPATIEGRQPARLADGEFVIDARTVSEIGNGSSKAGAKKLYAMMERVHRARKKAKRGEPSNADKYLPA